MGTRGCEPDGDGKNKAMSIIVPTVSKERTENLVELVRALEHRRMQGVELVIVVGKSQDLYNVVKSAVETEAFEVQVVYNPGNYGASMQRNFALEFAKGSIVAFLDDDIIPSESWARQIMASFVDSSVIGVAGPVLPIWPSNRILLPRPLTWVLSCTSWVPFMNGQVIPYAWTGNIAFRRTVFGLGVRFSKDWGPTGDQPYRMGEDVEFCLRAVSVTNGVIVWNSHARVNHKLGNRRFSTNYIVNRAYRVGVVQGLMIEKYPEARLRFASSIAATFTGKANSEGYSDDSNSIISPKSIALTSLVVLSFGLGFVQSLLSHVLRPVFSRREVSSA